MNFSSSLFLLYFLPAFLVLYFLLPHRFRNHLIIAGSIGFFFWAAPRFTFILLASIIADYYLIQVMTAAPKRQSRIIMLLLLLINIATLIYFKYTGFFVDQANEVLSWFQLESFQTTKVLMPLGISFITFQRLSYLFDVYRGSIPAAKRLQDYALFILFFPKILAGPIVRFAEFAPRLNNRSEWSGYEQRLSGFFRFSLGLLKKVMIANALGVYADQIFATDVSLLGTKITWLGILAYTFQIYFDFSAYSDMAIGLARMMGFHIKENFNNPYISTGIIEFWKRWHITLGTWLRDYLFLPLAYATSRKLPSNEYLGLKTDKWIYVIATVITMLICGFWHGAGWTFIVWGLYHGAFMAYEKLYLAKRLKKAGKIPATLITFIVVTLGWVVFRADSLQHALGLYKVMFLPQYKSIEFIITPELITLLLMAAFFSFAAMIPKVESLQMKLFTGIRSTFGLGVMTVTALLLFAAGLSYVVASGFNPFIYFRF